jgi:hypothetical protein
MPLHRVVISLAASLAALSAFGQLTLPPLSQHASVSQSIGMVTVNIDYGSPRVHAPGTNEDRHGTIWGGLVPYGLTDLGFGSCKQCPWRAGADWNTTFTVSHDVKVEGQALKAGTYGLSMIAQAMPDDWTLIFSNDSRNWGKLLLRPRSRCSAGQGQAHQERVSRVSDLRLSGA